MAFAPERRGTPHRLERERVNCFAGRIVSSIKGGLMNSQAYRPTGAFIGASWAALLLSGVAYIAGLWNAGMPLNEKGYYFVLFMYGLFSAVSLQKSVRDRLEGISVTGIYFGLCWLSLGLSLLLLTVGLWNATLSSSEKGFYAMTYLFSLFSVVAIQKNVRDVALFDEKAGAQELSSDV